MKVVTSLRALTLSCATLLATACAGDIKPPAEDEEEPPVTTDPGEGVRDPHFTSTPPERGVVTTVVDAHVEGTWVYLDLDTGRELTPQSPASAPDWDLAFMRFQVKSNGGISGTGGVEAVKLPGADFDAVTKAPEAGWIVDAEDSDDDQAEPDYVFLTDGHWYDYDLSTHALTAADQVYVVNTTGEAFFKIRFLGYYDDAGSAGFPSFKWAPVDAP